LEHIWEKSLIFIKEKVSQQNFDTWISPLRILAVEGSSCQLSVPNKFFKDWLTDNYIEIIRDSVSKASGIDTRITFVVDKSPPEKAVVPEERGVEAQRKPVKKGDIAKIRIHQSLKPNYNFDRFVVGPSNQFAHAAALAVAEQPARNYNPLFIYGGVGLGKTHLLNAIGIHTLALHAEKNVLYVSAEEFMNEMINSIRYDRMPKFREK
jgi:chromosomal replication initiator protein